jgi:hypothetical protein|tara:strand:- start:803 stop:1048 length:246 start_codon:yes stop_codon:yes gene_type:complete
MNPIETLVQQSFDKDFNSANKTFTQIMNDRMDNALEQERIKVSASIYNGVDAEQLELDLEDDNTEEVVSVESEEQADEDEV